MIVVNLFGGPGCGKSSIASGVFSRLKFKDINCEYVTEYPKDLVWEEREFTVHDQVYVFAKQYHRLWVLSNKVQVAVVDSPLLLSILYDRREDPALKSLVVSRFNEFKNVNFLLKREKEFQPSGRFQTEAESVELDGKVQALLNNHGVRYEVVPGTETTIDLIVNKVLTHNFIKVV